MIPKHSAGVGRRYPLQPPKAKSRTCAGSKLTENEDLSVGLVAHPEARTEVLREQLDCGTVLFRIRLRQVFHRFHEHALTVNILSDQSSVRASLVLDSAAPE